jgi:alkyl hydroperoxide reductase subunit AhpF
MVINAHKFAMLNDNITADMVEASEFPHLVQKYHVMGVPRTIINESAFIEGMVPETNFSSKILESIK